jgi:competence protein ComEA
MKRIQLAAALAALALLSGVAPALAEEKAAPADPAVKKYMDKKEKKAPRTKPVDINSASKSELMKVAGISGEYADKIIAGRPYVSKADLVTRKVIPEGVFVQIKRQIVSLPQEKGFADKVAPKK